jgi:tight adherence protein B
MSIVQVMLLAVGVMMTLVLGYSAMTGPSATKESARRLQSVRFRHSQSDKDKVEAQYRKSVAARKPTAYTVAGSEGRIAALEVRLKRTGKGWTVSQYLYTSLGIGIVVMLLVFLKLGAPLLALGAGLMVGAFVPHMWVGRTINKRLNNFIVRFPDALDLMVRGLRSGLPVTETLGIISSELPGPVGEEFKLVTERIRIGKTMEEALQDTANRMGIAEFNFFCITLAIQRETGGNLAETLANLGDVLRKRSQMKLKIKAMSSESKASAYIIGSLPFIVFALIYSINPTYMGKFFIDERLIGMGIGAFVWLALGGFIMAKMINFEI